MENYCNSIWPLIYDQYNHGRYEQELEFYSQELASCTGPVLEVACGTGMILLPLLKQGIDIYGFDLSRQMLQQLYRKAEAEHLFNIRRRVTQQNMIDFQIDVEFKAIIIPGQSFLHLPTQEDQLACLQNIHRHLCDDGTFMLNFFTPNLSALQSCEDPNPASRLDCLCVRSWIGPFPPGPGAHGGYSFQRPHGAATRPTGSRLGHGRS